MKFIGLPEEKRFEVLRVIETKEVAHRTPFQKTTVIGDILEAACHTLFEAAQRYDP